MKKTTVEKAAEPTNKFFVWLWNAILKPLFAFIYAQFFHHFVKKCKKFLKRNPEILTFPISFALWYGFGKIAMWFNPTVEAFPLVFIQDILFTVMKVAIYISAAWFIFKLIYGTFTKYLLSQEFKVHFEGLTSWQKILITLTAFFLVFLSFALVG